MVRLILLGTGSPRPRPQRTGSAYLVALDKATLMFDCGPGATFQIVRASFSPASVGYLFFTHHHFDHNSDYGFFTLCRWQEGAGKAKTLEVYGPRGTARITDLLFSKDGVYADDIAGRLNAPGSVHIYRKKGGVFPRPQPQPEVTELSPGAEVRGDGWKVTTAEAHHSQPYLDSLAYRLETPERTIVFSGDTTPCESVASLAAGAHTLVYCAHDLEQNIRGTPLEGFTSSTLGAARVAQQAGVQKLVLTHIGDAMDAPGAMDRELALAHEVFPGPIIVGQDLMEV